MTSTDRRCDRRCDRIRELAAQRPNPLLPLPHVVNGRRRETADTVTLWLTPVGDRLPPFRPGQFTMLYLPWIGEIPISISGDPHADDGVVMQTIKAVGTISRALHDARHGTVVGVRGPYGTAWDLAGAEGGDLLVVGGGCGLAPLRPVLLSVLARRAWFRRVLAVVGARSPSDLPFTGEISAWQARSDVELVVQVDRPEPGWAGGVGLVTGPLAEADLDMDHTAALLCGPEVMIRAAAEVLMRRGVPAERIQVSLERNMQCAVGWCGHCQLGPLLVCRDGPVVSYAQAGPLLEVVGL